MVEGDDFIGGGFYSCRLQVPDGLSFGLGARKTDVDEVEWFFVVEGEKTERSDGEDGHEGGAPQR